VSLEAPLVLVEGAIVEADAFVVWLELPEVLEALSLVDGWEPSAEPEFPLTVSILAVSLKSAAV